MTSSTISKYAAGAALAASLLFGACDNINEEDRFIPVERPTVERKVLIQEFTGIRCVNCPDAASLMHDLQGQYPESVIVVALHPKDHPFSNPIAGFSLATDEAKTYFEYYNGNELPAAIVNSGGLNSNFNQWSSIALSAMQEKAKLDIDLATVYHEDQDPVDKDKVIRTVEASYSVRFNEMYDGDVSVLVWIIENDITGPQMSTSGRIPEYTHRHVFRKSLNGDWGEQIGSKFTTDQVVEGSAACTIPEDWNVDNCQIVAFAFKTGDKGVENAEVVDVISKESNPAE